MPVSTDGTVLTSQFITSQRLNFDAENVAIVTASIAARPNNESKVIVAIYSDSDDLNNIHKFFIANTSVEVYANYEFIKISGNDIGITLNTEQRNTNARVHVNGSTSNYEGAKISVYKVVQPSDYFKETLVFEKNITFKNSNGYLLGTGYKFNPFFVRDRDNRLYTYKYQIDNNAPVTTQFRNPGPYGYTADNIVINTNLPGDVFDVRLQLPTSVSAGNHIFRMWMEPTPFYPTDLESFAELRSNEELVSVVEEAHTETPLLANTADEFNLYDSDDITYDVDELGDLNRIVSGCRAVLAVNEQLYSGHCASDGTTIRFVFGQGDNFHYPFEVSFIRDTSRIRYKEYISIASDRNNGQLTEGRRFSLYYVAKKASPDTPYKAIIPEQTIKFSSDDAGWPTDKSYQDELQDALDAGEEVHVELTFLDDGAPYSEPIDVFAPIELRDRGETIRITIMSDVWFSLYLFGDANGAVRTADDTYSYQGRIKFHVYTGTKPEPEPAPKPDPMMSSKWNKNFTAQYNDNSTAGEIKDFLRKEKKKITGHNIHELLDDLEEIGEGGDDSGSSCKCISLVEEIESGSSATTCTLKGATADKVYEAFCSGNPVGIVVNVPITGSDVFMRVSGYLGRIYLDSSNNTYYATVMFAMAHLSGSVGSFYAFTSSRQYSAMAGQELKLVIENSSPIT